MAVRASEARLEKPAGLGYSGESENGGPLNHGRTVMKTSLPVLNLDTAHFECIYGRGCDGLCCQNGRPGVYPEEEQRIRKNLKLG